MRLRRAAIRLGRDDLEGALDDIPKALPLQGEPATHSSAFRGSRDALVSSSWRDGRRRATTRTRRFVANLCPGRSPTSRSLPTRSAAPPSLPSQPSGPRDEVDGRFRSSSRDFVQAAEILHEIGDAELESLAQLRAAEQLVAEGRRAEADEQLQRSLAFWRSVQRRYIRQAEAPWPRRPRRRRRAPSGRALLEPRARHVPRTRSPTAARSRTVRVTSTSSGSDNADTRAAMGPQCPQGPPRAASPPPRADRSARAPTALNLVTDVRRATDGAAGPSNVARTPSPAVLQPAVVDLQRASARPARILPGQPANRDRRAAGALGGAHDVDERDGREDRSGSAARDREPVTNSSIAPSARDPAAASGRRCRAPRAVRRRCSLRDSGRGPPGRTCCCGCG